MGKEEESQTQLESKVPEETTSAQEEEPEKAIELEIAPEHIKEEVKEPACVYIQEKETVDEEIVDEQPHPVTEPVKEEEPKTDETTDEITTETATEKVEEAEVTEVVTE